MAFFKKSVQRRKIEKYINYVMLVLKTEWNRPKEFEEHLRKGIKGSNKLFSKQIRSGEPGMVSL